MPNLLEHFVRLFQPYLAHLLSLVPAFVGWMLSYVGQVLQSTIATYLASWLTMRLTDRSAGGKPLWYDGNQVCGFVMEGLVHD